jgi:hypothetical protein
MAPYRSLILQLTPLLLLCAAATAWEVRADPRLAEHFDSGAWQGSAFVDSETSTLSHCTVHTQYEGGQALVFVRSQQGFSVAVANPGWRLEPGTSYSVLIGVDDRWAERTTGRASDSRLLRVDLGFDARAVEAFRRGETLTVLAEEEATRLALTGTSGAILDLERCYLRYTVLAGADAQARATPASITGPGPRAQDLDWGTWTRLTLNEFTVLLRAAARSDGESGVPAGDLGFASYFFLVPDSTLSLYWEDDTRHMGAEALLQRHIRQWEAQCSGPTRTGKAPRETRAEGSILQGYVACDDPESTGYAALAVVEQGAIFRVLLTISSEPERATADAITRRFAELLLGRETRSARF